MKHRTIWKWFAMALGEKASKCDKESDIVARIRAVIFLTYLITNCFIVAGVIKHWNDNQDDQVSSSVSQTKEEIIFKTGGYVL
jgi:aspartyl/asparaginyl beta-hydroxylase (cupin superfamily)